MEESIYKGPEPKRALGFRVPASVRERLEKEAVELGVTLSEVCESALTRGMDRTTNGKGEMDEEILLDSISNVVEETITRTILPQITIQRTTPNDPEEIEPTEKGILLRLDEEQHNKLKTYLDACIEFASKKGVDISENDLLAKMVFYAMKKSPKSQDFANGGIFPEHIFNQKI